MYYVDGVPHSERSSNNQKIISLFARREVLKDVTSLVEYVFDSGTDDNAPPFEPGDIWFDAVARCPNCDEDALEEVVVEPHMVTPEYDPSADPDERYICPICKMPYGTQEEARQCCVGQVAYLCTNCQALISVDQMDELSHQIVPEDEHWYLVSDWLCKKLKDLGEPVIMTGEYSLWGRPTDAGELTDDPMLQKICSDIGILEGQPHAWPVH